MRRSVRAALALVTAACGLAVAGTAAAEPLIDVQLLAFNDFHGNLQPPDGGNGLIRTSNSPITNVTAGGAEYLATHLGRLEAQNPLNTWIVSGGDLIGASPLLSSLFHDEPTIEAMNIMGLDFNGVGNHEFDEGYAELERMQFGGCHPVDGCQDGTPFYGSVFQFLAANVVSDISNNPVLPAYEIVQARVVEDNGNIDETTKIAFIGETLEGTPAIVTPAGIQDISFLDEADTVNALVPHLKSLGVETIVVLLHQGGFQTGSWLYNTCNGLGGEIIDIVERMDDEIDVVVSGHTHQPYDCEIDGKLVTSASSFGRIVSQISLTLDSATGDVVAKSAENRIVTRDVPKDPRITDLIAHYEAIAGPIRDRVVGSASATITRTQNAAGESALGDVIADAQLAATAPTDFGGSKVAFMNPGGIRADVQAGEVTYGELFEVQPFGNTLIVKTCTGAQIEALLEQQWTVANRILQVSNGFTYTWDSARAPGDRVDPASIKIDGVTVDPAANYRVTMNSFLATGGDRFSVFTQCTNQLGGEVDVDALVRYFVQHSPVGPGPQNRITRTG